MLVWVCSILQPQGILSSFTPHSNFMRQALLRFLCYRLANSVPERLPNILRSAQPVSSGAETTPLTTVITSTANQGAFSSLALC